MQTDRIETTAGVTAPPVAFAIDLADGAAEPSADALAALREAFDKLRGVPVVVHDASNNPALADDAA